MVRCSIGPGCGIGNGLAMVIKSRFVLLVLLCCSASVWSKPKAPLSLTLKDAALLSIANNARAQNAQLQWVLDKYKWVLAKNAFEWQFDVSGEVIRKKGHDTYYATNPSASLALPTGGTLTAEGTWYGGGAVRNYLDEDGSLTLAETNQSGSLSLRQPLLRGFGPKVALANLHNAEDQKRMDEIIYERTIARTVTQSIKAYWEVLQAKQSQRVQELALAQAEKVLAQYKVRIKVGDMPASNAIQQQAQVVASRLSVAEQKNRVLQSHQDLLVHLGLKSDAKVDVDVDVKNLDMMRFSDLEESIAFGLSHHAAILLAKLELDQLKRNYLVAQNEQLWELDVEGQIDTEHDAQVGLKLSIPLRDIPRKQKLLAAKVQYEQAQHNFVQLKKEVETEIINHWRKLHLILNRIDLLDQKVALSAKNYHVTVKQHLNGRASSFEVVAQQQQWITDQIGLISAKIEYLKTLADFHLLIGKVFSTWGITLQ